jgi:hypothetical protein
MAKNKLTVNLNFRFNGQTGSASKITPALMQYGNFIFENVVTEYSEGFKDKALSSLEGRVYATIATEVERIAAYMKKGIVGRANSAIGPVGNLRINEASNTIFPAAQNAIGGLKRPDWDVANAAIRWADRSPDYLARKRKAPKLGVGHDRWFEYKNVLGNFLGSGKKLLGSFGPIKVIFIPTPQSRTAAGTFSRGLIGPTLPPNISQPGLPGRSTKYYIQRKVGRIEVSVFEKVTSGMISGDLSSFPRGDQSGLLGLLPQEIQDRLYPGNRKPYRMTIERVSKRYLPV